MYNQKGSLQFHLYSEATKLAAAGEEFSHLIKLMEPDYAMRLKVFVQQLPESVQAKTIYGRAHCKTPTKKK